MNEVTARITAYLAGGGLFNPELAKHDTVRDFHGAERTCQESN